MNLLYENNILSNKFWKLLHQLKSSHKKTDFFYKQHQINVLQFFLNSFSTWSFHQI